MNAKSMISQWEKEFNDHAKMKRRKAHRGKDREMMKHAILQDVIEFIKGMDIFHELIHSHSNGKENISPLQIMDSQPQVMPLPLQDITMDSLLEDMNSLLEPIMVEDMDSLLEDMDSLLEPIPVQDFDMDSLLEPIVLEDKDSLLEPINSFVEDMDSLLEPIALQDFNMDSLLEPITFDSLVEDKDSLLEPIVVEDRDSLLEPIMFDSFVEDKDSLLEPITFNRSSDVDEFNDMLCRLDSILEPVVVVALLFGWGDPC